MSQVARDFTTDFSRELAEFIRKSVSKHTVQLFTLDEDSGFRPSGYSFSYIPLGTGVLVTVNDDYYLFSASHVLIIDDVPRTLYIGIEEEFIPIQGNGLLKIHKDIDVGFVELEERQIEELKLWFDFLPRNKILENHSIINKGIAEYFCMGFPIKYTKFVDGNFDSGATIIITKLAKDEHYEYYNKLGFNYSKKIHYVLDYYSIAKDAFTLTKLKKNKDEYLKGLSDSGLWYYTVKIYFENEIEKWQFDYKLIGVMIENQDSKYKVLVATKIIHILDSLA